MSTEVADRCADCSGAQLHYVGERVVEGAIDTIPVKVDCAVLLKVVPSTPTETEYVCTISWITKYDYRDERQARAAMQVGTGESVVKGVATRTGR